jgi:hypothetical protein
MHARFAGILVCCAAAACAPSKGSAGNGGTSAPHPDGPAAQASVSLHLIATTTPGSLCLPGAHWVNIPFATLGGQQMTASSRAGVAVDGNGQMAVECSVVSAGSQFAVTANLESPATTESGSPLNPTYVQLRTTIAADQADATGTVSLQDDQSGTTYAAQDCTFSVHPAAAGDQLGVAPGQIWASVVCHTVRDEQSSNQSDVCQIESGYFALENCAQ